MPGMKSDQGDMEMPMAGGMMSEADEATAEAKAASASMKLNPRGFRCNNEDPAGGGNGDEPLGNPVA